jgi:CubicO group peptidase (beta-lactamase class C family)
MNNMITTKPKITSDASIYEIRTLIQHAIAKRLLPGAVVHVMHNGKTVYQEAFGMADMETGRSQQIDDLFYLGSTSKPLAVTSILTLIDESMLGLDDPASNWIPELNQAKLNNGTRIRSPTLREMLSHTSGIFGNASMTKRQQRLVWNFGSTLAKTATQIARQPYIYPPGEGFSYGGASMTIACRIAELVTSMEFDEFADKAVFKKLNMQDTFYRSNRDFKDRISVLYKTSAGGLCKARYQPHASPDSFILPAGGIISTARDLSSLLRLHLNNEKNNAAEVLSDNLLIEMHRDITNGKPMDFKSGIQQQSDDGMGNKEGYGLGWILNEIGADRSARVFFHGGAFGTLIWGDTGANLGIVLLTHVPLAQIASLWDDVIRIIRTTW